jgi:peroxiredoxin Q/BCP
VEKGDLVSHFQVRHVSGSARRLSEFLAEGPVVIYFYPAAMTKGCTAESCHFRDLAGDFAALGAQRLGVSPDGVTKQRQFAEQHSLGFPLLSDQTGAVARQFGVRRHFGPILVKRWTFVLDTDGRVLEVIKSETNMTRHADRALEVLSKRAQS